MIDRSMLYLADANVLITANNLYYPIDQVPEYWEWLAYMGSHGHVKMPFEIFEEVKDGPKDAEKDLLFAWLQDDVNKKALLLDEKVDPGLVQKVIAEGYAPDLTDDEIEQVGRDPFLIAYRRVGAEEATPEPQGSRRMQGDGGQLLQPLRVQPRPWISHAVEDGHQEIAGR